MGGPYFLVNRSRWDKHRDTVIEGAKSYGYNAIAVSDKMGEEPEIVWERESDGTQQSHS